MKKLVPIVTPVLAIVLMTGCKSASDVELADLQGVWSATQARYSGLEDPKNNNIDLIEEGFTVDFASDGSGDFVIRVIDPDAEIEFISGRLTVEGTDLTIVFEDESTRTGEVFLEGEQMAFSIDGGVEVDFNDDGRETEARLLLVLERESATLPS